MHRKTLRLATRKSPLAIRQAEIVKAELEQRHLHVDVEIISMSTRGDELLNQPLARIGGKGLFTAELEKALLAHEVDFAVHSMKDMPVKMPKGLHVPVITGREDPRDVLVSYKYDSLESLPKNAKIGTASLRRQCQLLSSNKNYQVETLRGNVQTRLNKCERGDFDAIILAAAGLKRMDLTDHIVQIFEPEQMLPAVGQGALGLQCRLDDKDTMHLLQGINCESTHACVAAERAVNDVLQGSCQVPLAMHARRYGPTLSLHALVGKPDGSVVLRAALSGVIHDPETLGRMVAEDLIAQGAREILDEVVESFERDGED